MMDLNSPDTDIPGAYRQSSVPLSVDPTDQQAMQQAMSSSLAQRYPASVVGMPTDDPDTMIRMLMQLLQQQSASPQMNMPPQQPTPPPPPYGMPPQPQGMPLPGAQQGLSQGGPPQGPQALPQQPIGLNAAPDPNAGPGRQLRGRPQ